MFVFVDCKLFKVACFAQQRHMFGHIGIYFTALQNVENRTSKAPTIVVKYGKLKF